jgi:hypothetical protein
MSSTERLPGRNNQLTPVLSARTLPVSRPAGLPAAAVETRIFTTPDGTMYRILPNNSVIRMASGNAATAAVSTVVSGGSSSGASGSDEDATARAQAAAALYAAVMGV